ncbi:hypothetical protein [Sphingomonas sp. 66-10]|uniref:DUF7010 family protein n=1 Tax=Sphingomonas sp. 66-10 TaxID=1895848 RepID=UPI00257AFBA9|nr:hypothetical protein [Sphingomonas sp. 66-10]
MTFEEMQADFVRSRPRVPSLPITGVIVYSMIAMLSIVVAPEHRNLTLFLGFWTIMPVGALLMKLRGERTNPTNPLFRLTALARVMVLSTWAIHTPVWIYAPNLFPLTVGIAFALHWVVLTWCVGNPVGLIHLGMRILFVLAAWHLCPDNRVGAVAIAVAAAYLISVIQLDRIHRAAATGLLPVQ